MIIEEEKKSLVGAGEEPPTRLTSRMCGPAPLSNWRSAPGQPTSRRFSNEHRTSLLMHLVNTIHSQSTPPNAHVVVQTYVLLKGMVAYCTKVNMREMRSAKPR